MKELKMEMKDQRVTKKCSFIVKHYIIFQKIFERYRLILFIRRVGFVYAVQDCFCIVLHKKWVVSFYDL